MCIRDRFDLVIEKPRPTDWVTWQRGKITPKLKWDQIHERLFERFKLEEKEFYVGMQVSAETNYGLWRNWPLSYWQKLIDQLEQLNLKVLLFGYGLDPKVSNCFLSSGSIV